MMQALWAEPHVTFTGKYHTIEDAGINPLPPSPQVPIWFGGHADADAERVVKRGDGWIMNTYAPGAEIEAEFDKLRRMAEAAGRDPAAIGLDVWVSGGAGDEASWRQEVAYWKRSGATHITLTNTLADATTSASRAGP